MSQRGFSSIFVLIVVLLMGAISSAYYIGTQKAPGPQPQNNTGISKIATQTPAPISDTDNWKTYSDQDNLFTLKYPPEWFGPENTDSNIILLYKPCLTCGGKPAGITILIHKNPDKLSSQEYVTKQIITMPNSNLTIINNKPSFLKDVDFTMVDGFAGAGSPPGPSFYIAKNDQIIEISADGVDLNTYGKILSTFKFIT